MALSHADVQYYYFCYLLPSQWGWASEGFGAQDFLWQKVSLLQSALAAKMCLTSAAGWPPRCRDCWALLCIVCQQAGCWGKKFLYLAAPRCSVPVAIAVHCSKLKPVCGVLCLWESVGVTHSHCNWKRKMNHLGSWDCWPAIWIKLTVLLVSECSKWQNQERVLHMHPW